LVFEQEWLRSGRIQAPLPFGTTDREAFGFFIAQRACPGENVAGVVDRKISSSRRFSYEPRIRIIRRRKNIIIYQPD
jgi:hypothetical protein